MQYDSKIIVSALAISVSSSLAMEGIGVAMPGLNADEPP